MSGREGPVAVYRAGSSALHRSPAWLKLLALAALELPLAGARSPYVLAVVATLTALGYLCAGFGPRVLLGQLWPLRWVVVLLVPFQWWLVGPARALVLVGTLLVAVAAAALLSLTTRLDDLLDLFTAALRPFARLGVDPDRVALLLALTVRSVSVLQGLARDAADARRARGLEHSPRALLVPLVVRTVRHALTTGDALVARGVDD